MDEIDFELLLRDFRLSCDRIDIALPFEEIEERGKFFLSCSFSLRVVLLFFNFGFGLQQQEHVIIMVQHRSILLLLCLSEALS